MRTLLAFPVALVPIVARANAFLPRQDNPTCVQCFMPPACDCAETQQCQIVEPTCDSCGEAICLDPGASASGSRTQSVPFPSGSAGSCVICPAVLPLCPACTSAQTCVTTDQSCTSCASARCVDSSSASGSDSASASLPSSIAPAPSGSAAPSSTGSTSTNPSATPSPSAPGAGSWLKPPAVVAAFIAAMGGVALAAA
ncbi:hypothetical protein MKEN_00295600 [Mycena kentingensis (nom. inval.)]|nr:hypothetical protein MKEN_00295600 [Mycena kentingensis (nom. inval.)]